MRKYNGNLLLITPSKKNMHAFLEKVRDVIHQNRTAKQENLIRALNPMIRGWANYHRHIVASSAYRKAGMCLWNSLWLWAKRRHPKKSATWIADRYWYRLGRRKWCFAVLADSNAQRSRTVMSRLVDPTKTPIARHVKVKSDANPFDPHWCGYFEDRKRLKMSSAHR